MIRATIKKAIDTFVILGNCDYKLISNEDSYLEHDNPSLKKQINKLKYYLQSYQSFNLLIKVLKDDEIFFQLDIEFVNTKTSFINFANSDLNQVTPRLNFI